MSTKLLVAYLIPLTCLGFIRLLVEERQTTPDLPEYLIYGVKTFNDYGAIDPSDYNPNTDTPHFKLTFTNKLSEKESPLHVIPIPCNQKRESVYKLLNDFNNRALFKDLKGASLPCGRYFDDCSTALMKINAFTHPFEPVFTERGYLVAFFGTDLTVQADYEVSFDLRYSFSATDLETYLIYVYTILGGIVLYNLYCVFKYL